LKRIDEDVAHPLLQPGHRAARPGREREPCDPVPRAFRPDTRGDCQSACFDLTAAFELSQPTISHHLKVLRDAGLVESSRRGTWAYYRLVPDAVRELRHTLGG
jgi:DNA-binding transcriptional ArsR family regulator